MPDKQNDKKIYREHPEQSAERQAEQRAEKRACQSTEKHPEERSEQSTERHAVRHVEMHAQMQEALCMRRRSGASGDRYGAPGDSTFDSNNSPGTPNDRYFDHCSHNELGDHHHREAGERRSGSWEPEPLSHGRRGFLSGYRSFSIIYRQGRILHDRAVKEFGLSGQQMGYLRHIYENPGISQEELAKEQFIDKGAVAKSIKDMIEKGYITREQNPDDKRAYCLFPTDKAEKIGKEGEECTDKIEKMLMEGLTEEEIDTFRVLLKKITDNMAKMLEGGKNE